MFICGAQNQYIFGCIEAQIPKKFPPAAQNLNENNIISILLAAPTSIYAEDFK